jgi:hypothetical protein
MVKALKPNLVSIIFKNSVRTSNRTQTVTITEIKKLMLFEEIIAVYSENLMKQHKYTTWTKRRGTEL